MLDLRRPSERPPVPPGFFAGIFSCPDARRFRCPRRVLHCNLHSTPGPARYHEIDHAKHVRARTRDLAARRAHDLRGMSGPCISYVRLTMPSPTSSRAFLMATRARRTHSTNWCRAAKSPLPRVASNQSRSWSPEVLHLRISVSSRLMHHSYSHSPAQRATDSPSSHVLAQPAGSVSRDRDRDSKGWAEPVAARAASVRVSSS